MPKSQKHLIWTILALGFVFIVLIIVTIISSKYLGYGPVIPATPYQITKIPSIASSAVATRISSPIATVVLTITPDPSLTPTSTPTDTPTPAPTIGSTSTPPPNPPPLPVVDQNSSPTPSPTAGRSPTSGSHLIAPNSTPDSTNIIGESTPQLTEVPTIARPLAPATPDNSFYYWITGLILLLGIIFLIWLFLLRRKKDNSTDQTKKA